MVLGRARLQPSRRETQKGIWALAPEVFSSRDTADLFNRNPSNSNKIRTADTSICTGSRAALPNSLDNTDPDRLTWLPPHARARCLPVQIPVVPCPPTLSWTLDCSKCRSQFPLGGAVAHRRSGPAPAVGHDQPGSQPPPNLHVLAALCRQRPIGLPHHD
jgi:hypothetical protein